MKNVQFAFLSCIAFVTSHAALAADVADAAYEGESKGGLPQFDPSTFSSQFFWLAIAFTILYFIFAKFTLPGISGVIENRKNLIESDLEMAEKLTKEADDVHDAYNANLASTQDEAASVLAKAEEKTRAKYEKKSEEFREKSETAVAETEARISEAKEKAMADMNSVITDVASDAIEKIIGSKADKAKVQSIVENIDGANKPATKVKAA
ncbi:MAG: F0F1 ATP synthase subunit B [Pseudomonadota bacterium]